MIGTIESASKGATLALRSSRNRWNTMRVSPVYVSADAIWRWGFAVSLRQCRTFARFARWILNQAWHGPCLPAPRKEGPASRGSAAGMLWAGLVAKGTFAYYLTLQESAAL